MDYKSLHLQAQSISALENSKGLKTTKRITAEDKFLFSN